MKNNYGFAKFELVTVIVLIFVIFAFLMYYILEIGDSNREKIKKFKDDAYQFNKTVYTNIDSFRDEREVYLDEVLEQNFITKMKSPFSNNQCSVEESKVESPEVGSRYVTLRCDDYLLDHVSSEDISNATVYKVSDWSDKRMNGDNVEEKVLYNCLDNNKEIFDKYLEEDYFINQVNKKYSFNNYTLDSITDDVCIMQKKLFYRTKEIVEEK